MDAYLQEILQTIMNKYAEHALTFADSRTLFPMVKNYSNFYFG